jgi:hypothetical protein
MKRRRRPGPDASALSALAEARVLDLDSHSVRLGDFWADRPAVVVFLRHFG